MVAVNYKLIKNFFSNEELNLFQKYCYNKLDEDKDYVLDSQSFSPAWYNDPLMNSLLDTKLKTVEKESNLKLFPTYAYWRYYVFGGKLEKHLDRPACEISITACIKKYDNWPIIIEGESFELEEGDAVLYAGYDQEHWRPGIYEGEGMAQVFLHYVNKEGKFTDHAYDNYRKTTGKKG
mgnify:CR=1 FL=1|jgi:hypothetical protein|tara:strand:+ start:2049 stop:2582 length:534 start_codon:yes stop_codon:yes gene_type:complete